MVLHLLAFTSQRPAIEFKLQRLIRSWSFVRQMALLGSFRFLVSGFKTIRSEKLETGKLETEEYATFAILMSSTPQSEPDPEPLYCPRCTQEVSDPLTCGDCSAVICRRCGTPLESPDELGMG
jgi:hypothetical protein